MKIITGKKGSGKTTELIKESAESKYPIVVANYSHELHILELAKTLKFDIPQPILANNLPSALGREYEGFLIDEIGTVLPILLNTSAQLKGLTIGLDNLGLSFKNYDE